MKLLVAVSITCMLGVAFAAVGQVCTDESQCDAGECCQILSEFMVVSKKDILPAKQTVQKSGTCQMYKKQGDYCNSFDAMNGYCSCGPSLTCHTRQEPLPTLAPVQRAATHMTATVRRSMLAPQNGYKWVSTCEAILP